jgi:hypothetical protein
MSGLYNFSGGGMWNPGQFMSSLFDNYQTNLYNQKMDAWRQQMAQYKSDLDYFNQMQDYDQDMLQYGAWSSGADRMAPLTPRQAPVAPQRPSKPLSQGSGGGFGGFGGGGSFRPSSAPGYRGFNYGAFQGEDYQPGEAWVNPGIDTANMVDPTAVIQSAQPGIMEKMHDAFADAGNRFGSSGMVGTPYADALGDASRSAATDIAHITNQYTYQSALDAAQREQERAMAEYAADYNAWAQQGQWGHEGQLADMNQALSSWGQMGDWMSADNQLQNQLANQQWMAQNDWRFQDQQSQQQMQHNMMMQIIPHMMQMMGGMF